MFEKLLIFLVYDKMKIQSNRKDAVGSKKKGDIFFKDFDGKKKREYSAWNCILTQVARDRYVSFSFVFSHI